MGTYLCIAARNMNQVIPFNSRTEMYPRIRRSKSGMTQCSVSTTATGSESSVLEQDSDSVSGNAQI